VKCLTYFAWLLIGSGALLGQVSAAEQAPAHPVNIVIVRTGEQLQGPHVVTYRLAEWEQMRGRWIPADFGYYDTGYGKDQIWFGGGGVVVTARPRFRWEQEVYVSQETGPQSENRRAVWIWPVFYVQPNPRLSIQVAPYPTIPLDRAQRWSFNFDRAKIEWSINSRWRAGVGYSGGICSARTWQNEPFLTATRRTHLGSFEMWLQSMPGSAQVQLRYVLVKGEN
jgi:hypothetical protein